MSGRVDWMSVKDREPEDGEYVVVYNGKFLWSTHWTPALSGPNLPMPVTHWTKTIDLPYPLVATPSFDADPLGCRRVCGLARGKSQ